MTQVLYVSVASRHDHARQLQTLAVAGDGGGIDNFGVGAEFQIRRVQLHGDEEIVRRTLYLESLYARVVGVGLSEGLPCDGERRGRYRAQFV